MDDFVLARVEGVRRRVAAACARAGRSEGDVTVVAVSKGFGPDRVRELAECGFAVFGENRVQEARAKIPECPGGLAWHLVGHLQRNKARHAAECFDMVHSIDSWAVLEALNDAAERVGRRIPVLIEVNVSGEGTKYGLAPAVVPDVAQRAGGLSHVEPRGLMTIPPFAADPEDSRPHFRRLRELRDSLRSGAGLRLDDLSMGMSGDFEVAIEEGATMVRVGTALFGPRERLVRAERTDADDA
jgi:pyridoxal phosphate enzyme (YggS family)